MPIPPSQATGIALWTVLAVSLPLAAQEPPPTTIRAPELRRDAIVGVEIVPSPGERIKNGVILLADGVIEALGSDLEVPPGYRVHERSGMVVYPGLVEPALLVSSTDQAASIVAEHGAYPNPNVVPQLDVATFEAPLASDGAALRSQGFCTALLLPSERIFRGQGQVVLLDEDASRVRSLGGVRPQTIGLDARGGWRSGGYPGSSMGVVALVRQVLSDADWHARCREVWANHPDGNEPPVDARALDALAGSIQAGQPFLIDTTSEVRALRAARIAREFELDAILLGSGTEFRRAEEIAATGYPVLVPLAFPKKPEATGARSTEGITLRTLLTWKHAPENPRRLVEAGSEIAFTTHRLEDRSNFRANLAKAIEAGLSRDAALEALTRTPARLLEVDEVVGTIEPGRIANLVVVDGDLFEPKDPIREVWVGGRRHSIKEKVDFAFTGPGQLRAGELTRRAAIDREQKKFEVQPLEKPEAAAPEAEAPEEEPAEAAQEPTKEPSPPERETWRARSVSFSDQGVSGIIDGEAFEVEGPVRFDAVLIAGELHGIGQTADGNSIRFLIAPIEADDSEPKSDEDEDEEKKNAPEELASLPRPLGAFGRLGPPQEETVLFRNARIWTSAEPPILEGAELLVRDGRIVDVGHYLEVPEGTRIEDASGKQITPGLIDCHSHTGIDGSVNEFGQNNSAEVRIGDVLEPDDINWYRQLAGGLTTANQLHGSANPIGGQNAVVKLRWGADTDGMHLQGAKPGIKFALGENVVRPDNRYPDTRMGVAAFIEDAFRAASEYDAEHARWAALSVEEQERTMPPRRDLELETLAEILASERIIHCHSYRQDEILMLIRTAERWGFTIGTLQHVLEGYKVAEAIAAHGAGASSFSDWWAYKMEVMDAIPYNGALMTKVGVVTSFNSDSDEVARRMNTEAAKAVRYGGLEPHEALKLVTINPAKQLRIDNRTGSLEPGKDADFVVWNGDPLSTYTRCEQTWIDGRKYFDHEEDVELSAQAGTQRAQLLASLAEPEKKGAESAPDAPEGRRRGPPGGWRGRRGPPPVEVQRQSTLARMLEAREDFLFELVRRGFDPEEIRPGACGCDDVSEALSGTGREAGR